MYVKLAPAMSEQVQKLYQEFAKQFSEFAKIFNSLYFVNKYAGANLTLAPAHLYLFIFYTPK